ncbi:MAG: site-specific integrase [Armatimonadota bacterium]
MENNTRALTGLLRSPYNTSENHRFAEVPTRPQSQANVQPPPFLSLPTDANEELARLAKHACHYYNYQLATSTLNAYASDWRGFQRWCQSHGLDSLPSDITTVALYAAWMAEQSRRPSTIQRHLAAIRAKHEEEGYPTPTKSPVVKRVMHGINRKHGSPSVGAEAILPETLQKMLAAIDKNTLIGKRDRALLLLGYAGAFRRSELVGLNVADIQWHDDEGIILQLSHSKTDQEGRGRLVGIPRGKHSETCPVTALKAWLTAASIREGAIFRGMDCHSRIVSPRLTGRAVSMIIKRHVKATGLDTLHYSGHSLRAGHCTAAARAGVSEKLIMAQSGHRSHGSMLKYIRSGKILKENSASFLGF